MGTNTLTSTSEVAMTGPVTSFIAWIVASRGFRPSLILRSTFSTTTMASSTTIPMARIRPKSESTLMENPRKSIMAKVPTIETGTAKNGMTEARQVCRKTITTKTTSSTASNNVWITD